MWDPDLTSSYHSTPQMETMITSATPTVVMRASMFEYNKHLAQTVPDPWKVLLLIRWSLLLSLLPPHLCCEVFYSALWGAPACRALVRAGEEVWIGHGSWVSGSVAWFGPKLTCLTTKWALFSVTLALSEPTACRKSFLVTSRTPGEIVLFASKSQIWASTTPHEIQSPKNTCQSPHRLSSGRYLT